MVTTTIQEPAGPQAVPPVKTEPGKRPPGRPTKLAPPPPSEAGSFWEWIDSIPKDDWQNLICYVWRTGPFLNLSQTSGKPISLEKLAQPFDVTYMLKTHGSGGYRFDVCYTQPNGTEKKRIRQAYETIIDMRYPPRVPAGEWLDDPRNKDWAWAKPQLEAEEKDRVLRAAASLNGAPEQAQSKTAELGELLELAEKLRGKGDNNAGLLVELIKMNDPTKVLTLAKEIAAVQNPAPKEDGAMGLLMKFLVDELKDMRQVRATAPDPLDTATKLLTGAKDLFGTLGMGQAPAAAATNPDTASTVVSTVGDISGRVVDKLGDYTPGLIGLFTHLKDRDLQIAEIRVRQGMAPDRPWEFQGSRVAPVATAVQARPDPAAAPAAPSPVSAPPPAPGVMTPQLLLQKYNAILNAHFMILIDKFKNEDGYRMQDHLLDREGRNTFNAFREDATVELLLGMVSANAQLKTIFTPPEKAGRFFEELLSEPPPAGEQEEEEDDEEESLPIGQTDK